MELNGKSYVTADLSLFNTKVARRHHMTVNKYNNKVIEKINQTLTDKDTLYIIGEVYSNDDNKEKAEELLQKINGEVIILKGIDSQKEYNFKNIKEWKLDAYIKGQIKDCNEAAILITNSEKHLKSIPYLQDIYAAAPNSILQRKELYEDKILNISFADNNFNLFELTEELARVIDNIEIFNSMENKETIL